MMPVESLPRTRNEPAVEPDFMARLEASLQAADRDRRRRTLLRRVRALMPILLLVGPVIAWRLTLVSGGSAHVAINSLAWLTFLLDVGVHVDGVLLSYLGLAILPTIVGALIFVLLAVSLLSSPGDRT